MKKTGKFCWTFFSLFLLQIGSSAYLGAQNLNVQASVSETTIFTGERITLTIEVSGSFSEVSRPQLPEFQGLRLLSTTPSTSRSYSFVNGRSSSSFSYSYSLLAQNEGDYLIPSISVTIDGNEYETDPISISIVDRNTSANNSSASTRPEVFLQLEVSDTTPVAGQQIITDVVLYFQSGLEINSFQPVPGWKAEGFWKEELENGVSPQAESVLLNGVRYRKARLLQFALFPTKAGELTISPYEVLISVRSPSTRNDPFGSFFGGVGTNQRQVELASDPVAIQVSALPETETAEFIGAVGSFEISRSISTRQAVAGEIIEIETRINGTGNIPLISKPRYRLPDGLEIYEPRESSSIDRNNQRISGSKVFTDVLIARTPGTFTLPATTLAFFNPTVNRYITETLTGITFTVEEDPNAFAETSGQLRSLGISPVTGLANWVTVSQDSSSLLTGRWWFWAGLALPIAAVAIAWRVKTFREKMSSDKHFARSRQAFDKARELLQEAITVSENGNVKEAYNLLHKALTNFIGDKVGLPQAGLSDREYIRSLEEKGVDPEMVKNVRLLLDKCSTISYAPSTSHEYLKSHVGLAETILNKLKKDL